MTTEEAIITVTLPVLPHQWPDAVKEKYEPVQMVGKGGFASVMLARNKNNGDLVAIKIAGSNHKHVTKMEIGYAHREIDILRELQHPNIMRLIESWDKPSNATVAAVMALSYAPGPTVQKLLRYGALSLSFTRVVAAQMVSALGYLHSRAVLHRDIKPDNIIVTGASTSQDAIFMENSQDTSGIYDEVDWQALHRKWHVTLCDFGFARALGPEDLKRGKIVAKKGRISLHDIDGSVRRSLHDTTHSMTLNQSISHSSGRQSVSHKFTRKMSAVGNRLFAAPVECPMPGWKLCFFLSLTALLLLLLNCQEIINGVRDDPNISIHNSSGHPFDIMQSLSHHVSNYGMMADSYSFGNTLKYMLTGVQPNENVDEVIAFQNNPISKLCTWLSQRLCQSKNKSSSSSSERKIHYRSMRKLPTEVVRLIRGLTNPNVSKRTSIRAARRFFWIDDILDEDSPEVMPQRIDYLPCAS